MEYEVESSVFESSQIAFLLSLFDQRVRDQGSPRCIEYFALLGRNDNEDIEWFFSVRGKNNVALEVSQHENSICPRGFCGSKIIDSLNLLGDKGLGSGA